MVELHSSVEAIVNTLASGLDDDFTIDVRRSNLLQDALKEARKKKFDVTKMMKVRIYIGRRRGHIITSLYMTAIQIYARVLSSDVRYK